MVSPSEQEQGAEEVDQGAVEAWYTRMHSDYNHGLVDRDQLERITTSAGESPEKIKAAFRLMDELNKGEKE